MDILASDLLPLVLRYIPAEERCRVREWCSSARNAFDAQCSSLTLRDAVDRDANSFPSFVSRILSRGCRPRRVALDIYRGTFEERRTCGTAVLDAFKPEHPADHSRLRGPSALALNISILNSPFAHAVASAFPALEELDLIAPHGTCRSVYGDVLEGLSLLLGTSGPADSPRAEEGGGPLLPELTCVRLSFGGKPCDVPWGLTCCSINALKGRAGLQELAMTPAYINNPLAGTPATDLLGSFVQLRALTLQFEDQATNPMLALPPVLRALTSLTRLVLGVKNCKHACELPLAALAGLTGLQQLDARSIVASSVGLDALRSLTSLSVLTLLPPPPPGTDNWTRLCLHTPSSSSLLPPLLRNLSLHTVSVPLEVLGALGPLPAGLVTTFPQGTPMLRAVCGRHTTSNGALLPCGEAVLCGAIRLLAGCRVVGISFDGDGMEGSGSSGEVEEGGGCSYVGRVLLRPAPGAAGVGGSHHGAWLAAMTGSAALRTLKLTGVRLSVQDFESIARHLPSLQELFLHNPSCAPVHELALLTAGLPRLKKLLLGVNHWEASMAPASVEACAALSAVLAVRSDARFGEQPILSVEGYKNFIFLDKTLEVLRSKVRYEDLFIR
ncbi:hypothetical protein TSOC_003461 [Tetrabaena socialis]|uniref:F-box domain-containing protein n=1 Tax=Tetrabaena socialis TaxID=47790 RepID=A0A2J8ABG3_9CHLO|nr:hypothetical protein TSOC_003461 [Tetrabaena socialis]|eukprot:PNH09861.1 hypothetical protein TSOC_003461 [Tetrabaena socialis]